MPPSKKKNVQFYPLNTPGLGGMEVGPNYTNVLPGRHGKPYDINEDVTRSVSPVPAKGKKPAATPAQKYFPKHSNRSWTPAEHMRARIAASQGKTYVPDRGVSGKIPGVTKGQVQMTGPKQNRKRPSNLNQHQFKVRAWHSKHEGKNRALLASMRGKQS